MDTVPNWFAAGGFVGLIGASFFVLRWSIGFMVGAAETANEQHAAEIARLAARLELEEQRCDRLQRRVEELEARLR